MKPQLSQNYNVDGRYSAGKGSADDDSGKAFVASYIKRLREEQNAGITEERKSDNRFIVSGPGDEIHTFRNAFRPSK